MGHPTSYALLGGERRTGGGIEIELPQSVGQPYDLGPAAEVYLGLPPECRFATASALEVGFPTGFVVTIAAHDVFGSSIVAFQRVAALLRAVFDDAVAGMVDSEDVRSAWERIRSGET